MSSDCCASVEAADRNTAKSKYSFFIPQGFAHGYLVLSDQAVFLYKCDNYYQPTAEGGIKYNDPAINIKWPDLDSEFIVSAKDNSYPLLPN